MNLAHRTITDERILWYDGDTTVTNMEFLYDKILRGESIAEFFVEQITPEIRNYNHQNPKKQLLVKSELAPFSHNWNIPDEYKVLPIRKVVLKRLEEEIARNKFSDSELEERITRVEMELELWESEGLSDLLKALIYIVDVLRENNVVWGTGRGSSCASYVLYLVGLHDVDSVLYNLDVRDEFFKLPS